MDLFNPYYLQIIKFFLINSLMGISIYFTLTTGQLSLGAAGFMSVGAYTAALLALHTGMPLALGIIIGGLAAALIGLVVGIPTTRLQGLYLAIATLGVGEVVRVIFLNVDFTNGALGLAGIPSLGDAFQSFVYTYGLDSFGLEGQSVVDLLVILILFLVLCLTILFCLRIQHSRVGRAFAAIKADEHAAELMGINTFHYKLVAFVIGAFMAGIGGGLYAHVTNFINPTDFSYHRVVSILLYTVFGGSNVVWGSVLGAFVLTTLPEALRAVADYRDLIYGALLVIMMAFRPDGILMEDTIKHIKKWVLTLGKSKTEVAHEEPIEPSDRSKE